jgi:hypothetical protein
LENERRTSVRKAFGQEVVINHEKGLRFCKIKNISIGGAFLDIGWGALTRHVPLELSLRIKDDGKIESLKLPAQVARVTTDGIAVSFGQLDADARRAISEFVTH